MTHFMWLGPYAEEPEWGAPPQRAKIDITLVEANCPGGVDLTDPQNDE